MRQGLRTDALCSDFLLCMYTCIGVIQNATVVRFEQGLHNSFTIFTIIKVSSYSLYVYTYPYLKVTNIVQYYTTVVQ